MTESARKTFMDYVQEQAADMVVELMAHQAARHNLAEEKTHAEEEDEQGREDPGA